MKYNPNILIMGFGSIGRRHYRNLQRLGYTSLSVFDTDKRVLHGVLRPVSRWNEIRFEEFDIAFVCSPTHLHVRHALPAAKAGCHLFIEKPLAHRMDDARRLAKLCGQKKLTTMVGCNLRFHPCAAFIKAYLSDGKLGKVFGIHHEFGHYLPQWRAGTDYRRNYAAKRRMGGGIILDDIHEFDLLFWLNSFTAVRKSRFVFAKSSSLKIETEDNCVASFEFANGTLGSVRCDYLQKHYSRSCKAIGERGNLFLDFNKNSVWLENERGRKKLFSAPRYDVNRMYLDEAAYFLRCIREKKQADNDIRRTLTVLQHCIKRC